MKNASSTIAALLSLTLALPALAQETTTPAPAEGAAAEGQAAAPAADGPGSSYIKQEFDDWSLRCMRVEQGEEPCQIGQLLNNPEGSPVGEISIFALPAPEGEAAPEGEVAVAGATFIAPLETLLTAGVQIKLEGQEQKVYPFTFCTEIGCIAQVGFTQAELDSLKSGNKAEVAIVPVVNPDTVLLLNVSLKGFTAGYEAAAATPAQ